MNKFIIVAATAIAAFVITTLYLHHRKADEPAPVPQRTAAVPAESSPPPAASFDSTRVATGYHNAPKVSGARFEIAQPPPDSAAEENQVERRLLNEYVGGISNVAPVSPEQARALLEAKLRHKKAYEAQLRDAGLDRESLSPAEREYAHTSLTRALNEYKENYLLDAKPILTDEQFTLLSNFETTEFNRELQRLQIAINSK